MIKHTNVRVDYVCINLKLSIVACDLIGNGVRSCVHPLIGISD